MLPGSLRSGSLRQSDHANCLTRVLCPTCESDRKLFPSEAKPRLRLFYPHFGHKFALGGFTDCRRKSHTVDACGVTLLRAVFSLRSKPALRAGITITKCAEYVLYNCLLKSIYGARSVPLLRRSTAHASIKPSEVVGCVRRVCPGMLLLLHTLRYDTPSLTHPHCSLVPV